MSIVIDGFAILAPLGKHADTFAVVRADVDKQARALVVKCLKKAVGLNGLREIHHALGDEQIGLVIEGLKDAEVKSLLTRLDKHHPDVKNGTVNWRSRHLRALADGSSDPAPPPVKAAKKSGGKKAKLGSATIDVFRAGANKKS